MTISIDSALRTAADIWAQYFPYTAAIKSIANSIDSSGGQTVGSTSTIASGLPLFYESLRNPITRTVGGKETIVGTHQLYFKADANTSTITAEHEIWVDAYNDESAKVFVRPVMLDPAYGYIVTLAAVLKE